MEEELKKCTCCGEYYPADQAVNERFCSWTCAASYCQCRNCGRYFIREQGFSDDLCSVACSEIHERETRY